MCLPQCVVSRQKAVSEWVSGWVGERVSEQVGEWVRWVELKWVCGCVHVGVCVYACGCMGVHVCVPMYEWVYVCVCVCACTLVHVCMYVHVICFQRTSFTNLSIIELLDLEQSMWTSALIFWLGLSNHQSLSPTVQHVLQHVIQLFLAGTFGVLHKYCILWPKFIVKRLCQCMYRYCVSGQTKKQVTDSFSSIA